MSQYVVQAGDSWMSIAGKAYSDQRQYGAIMAANPHASLLHPGDVIEVPDMVAPDPVITNEQWAQTPTGYDKQTGQPIYGHSDWQGYGNGGGSGSGGDTTRGGGSGGGNGGGNGHGGDNGNGGNNQHQPATDIPTYPMGDRPGYDQGPRYNPPAPSGRDGAMDYINTHQGTPGGYPYDLPYSPMADRAGYDQGPRYAGPPQHSTYLPNVQSQSPEALPPPPSRVEGVPVPMQNGEWTWPQEDPQMAEAYRRYIEQLRAGGGMQNAPVTGGPPAGVDYNALGIQGYQSGIVWDTATKSWVPRK